MNLEALKKLEKKYAQAIANYLLNRIETDECLKAKIEETNKTLKGCVEYVKKEAKKQAEDNVAIIEDQQVYEWAVHYFLEDSIDFEPKEKLSKKKNKNDDKEEEETEKDETLFGEEEVVKEEKKSIPKETKTKKDIKKKLFDQISLFDL